MSNILVSIVSEQTVPNYLFIKEFQQQIDKFIFISTEQMEQKEKTKQICETAGIEKNKRIKTLIKDDLLTSNIEHLNKLNLSNEDNYLINLTGGTKMMAIAVWRFFSRFKNVRYFYVPINKNDYNEVFEDKTAISTPFTYKITLKEYLNIYGIRYEQEQLIFSREFVEDIYNDVQAVQYELDKFTQKKLSKFDIPNNKQYHTKWFEEYVYHKIKKELNLNENQIATGIKLFEVNQEKKVEFYNNDNEIDVVFLHNNRPFLIECKFNLGKEKINTTTLGISIYKLAAVNKRFGISAKSTIFTLSNLDQLNEPSKQNLERRLAITGVFNPLFDRNIITNNSKFSENLNKFIK